MRNYTINLSRGLEVDIFDLPEDFKEQVEQAFKEYTSGTAKEYMYMDKLRFIDGCVKYINGNRSSDEMVNILAKKMMCEAWDERKELIEEDDIYSFEFMQQCYDAGIENASLSPYPGKVDRYIYDQIQKVLVQIITIVMNYENEEDAKC